MGGARPRPIVEEVAAADGERAVRAMRTHVDGARTRLNAPTGPGA
ncbi:hypothetical protein [Streptomyces sp. NPDC060022]